MITVKGPDGKEFQAPLPEGFLPITTVEKDYIPQSVHKNVVAGQRHAAAQELLGDEAFKADALKRWGVTLPAGGGNGGGTGGAGGAGGAGGRTEPDPALVQQLQTRIREEIDAAEIKPLREENEAARAEVEGARQLIMERAVVDAALAAGVDPALCTGINGDAPEITKLLAGHVAFDPKTRRVFAADPTEDTFRVSGRRRGEGEPPYMTVPELLDDWVKTHPRYIVKNTQRGAGFGGAGGGSGGGKPRTIQGGNTPESAREIGRNLAEVASGEIRVTVPGVAD
jgi:hypothetical protein